MRRKPMAPIDGADKLLSDIERATRRNRSPDDKIRIVIAVMRGEESIAELFRKEGIHQKLYYRCSKEFLKAGKKRLAGDALSLRHHSVIPLAGLNLTLEQCLSGRSAPIASNVSTTEAGTSGLMILACPPQAFHLPARVQPASI
jgi:transposase-like protein